MDARTNPAPLRQQVYLRLRAAIEQGTFAPGSKLPPSREHAQALGVGRNTVLWALERLQAEGYVVARVGDGSYVAPDLAGLRAPARRQASTPLLPASGLSQRGRLIAETALRWRPPAVEATAFRIGTPAIDAFPFAQWSRLERSLPLAVRQRTAHYLSPAGHMPLREAVAQWLLVSRGIRCEAAQVVITSGSQQAIDLVARLLLDPGDEVLVEDPGYLGIRSCLLGHGVAVRPVPVDAQGLDIAQGAARWPAARMAVVTPTHQFPLGVHMGLTRRLEVLAWARQQRSWVIEDDYDGEFQYGTHRIPALCSLPHSERVLYVGTFSKTLHPGLRLGFIVLPPALVEPFASAKALSDRHSPGEVQELLARFITEGHLLRHLRRMRELYQERQAVLIEALRKASGGALQLQPSAQGMHLAHEVGARVDDTVLSRRAAEAGVYLAPLSLYCVEARRRGWLLGYAGFEEGVLRRGAKVVGGLLP
ncbi:MAG TPA: PLP-dependent aminotransferase family protein [Rhizobacter sp.]|nr:PLP-dependent aminotransferase family protein [Rhizobacter sp.]